MADTTPNDVRPMSDAPLRFEAPSRKMDLATLFGLVAALALIAVAVVMNGSPLAFIDVPAILMVVLGTFAVTAISYTGEELREAVEKLLEVIQTEATVAFEQRDPAGDGSGHGHALRSVQRDPLESVRRCVDWLKRA